MATTQTKPFYSKTNKFPKSYQTALKDGKFSATKTMPIFKKGYGYCDAFGYWLEDNGIVRKQDSSKSKKLKVKTYEEAIQKLKNNEVSK